jgi:hypothetical protein
MRGERFSGEKSSTVKREFADLLSEVLFACFFSEKIKSGFFAVN